MKYNLYLLDYDKTTKITPKHLLTDETIATKYEDQGAFGVSDYVPYIDIDLDNPANAECGVPHQEPEGYTHLQSLELSNDEFTQLANILKKINNNESIQAIFTAHEDSYLQLMVKLNHTQVLKLFSEVLQDKRIQERYTFLRELSVLRQSVSDNESVVLERLLVTDDKASLLIALKEMSKSVLTSLLLKAVKISTSLAQQVFGKAILTDALLAERDFLVVKSSVNKIVVEPFRGENIPALILWYKKLAELPHMQQQKHRLYDAARQKLTGKPSMTNTQKSYLRDAMKHLERFVLNKASDDSVNAVTLEKTLVQSRLYQDAMIHHRDKAQSVIRVIQAISSKPSAPAATPRTMFAPGGPPIV